MKKNGRRIISFILSAVMIFALLPVFGKPMVVKAEDTPAEHVAHDEQCSAEETDCEYHKGWTAISDAEGLMSLGKVGGSGYLVKEINISEVFKIESGKTVNLCLNGHSITQNADTETDVIQVDGTVNLYDKNDNFGKITHANGKLGRGITSNGTFIMYGGTITGNITNDEGGGVNNIGVYDKDEDRFYPANFTMDGGTIEENESKFGGGVLNRGNFIMKMGTIKGNKAFEGGGVENVNEFYYDNQMYQFIDLYIGNFTMEGGTIEGNESTTMGGGVNNCANFTMNGGTIERNKASSIGGGVINFGTFTMNGGNISNNECEGSGGGVFNHSPGTFRMEGGAIEKNDNGVYNDFDATFTMNGGYIADKVSGYDKTLYTVTFNSNDGNGKVKKQSVPEKEDRNLTSNEFEYRGKVFTGWNTDPEGKGTPYADKKNINIANDLILYAQWRDAEKIGYNVSFNIKNGKWDEDGSTGEKKVEVWKYENESIDLLLEEAKIPQVGNKPNEGYKAGSWDTEPDTINVLTENKIYTYTFAPIEYTVEYDSNGGVGAMDDQSRAYDDKTPLTANTFTFEGKAFNGWNTADDGSGTHFKDEEVNNLSSTEGDTVTLYAQWTTNTYTVSWKDYDGTVLETDTDVAYGSTPTYDGETPKRDGAGNIKYTFSGWTPAIDIVKGTATYTATYSENEIIYTITFDANGGKADTTTGTSNAEFKLSSLPTPTYEGYKFKGWFTEATGGSEISADTVYTQDTTIYAQWEKVEEPEEPTTPEEPQEPTEPDVPVITEPEPELPEKDWLDDLRLALNIADELGGPQTVEYSGDFALSYDIMQYLVEHPDITFVYHITYEDVEYTIRIPAGKAVAYTDIPWYGPLWLLANYGNTNN